MANRPVCPECGEDIELEIQYEGRDFLEWSEEHQAFIATPREEVELYIECGRCGNSFPTTDIHIIYMRHEQPVILNRRIAEIGLAIGIINHKGVEINIEKNINLEYVIQLAKKSLHQNIESAKIEEFVKENLSKRN